MSYNIREPTTRSRDIYSRDIYGCYLQSIANLPLLTRDEEQEIGKRLESHSLDVLRTVIPTRRFQQQLFALFDLANRSGEVGFSTKKYTNRKKEGNKKNAEEMFHVLAEKIQPIYNQLFSAMADGSALNIYLEQISDLIFTDVDNTTFLRYAENTVVSKEFKLEDTIDKIIQIPDGRRQFIDLLTPTDGNYGNIFEKEMNVDKAKVAEKLAEKVDHLESAYDSVSCLALTLYTNINKNLLQKIATTSQELIETNSEQLISREQIYQENFKGIIRARDQLMEGNVRLVISIAKKYKSTGIPLIDLIGEGNIGLSRAVAKFDYRLGYTFSTYASYWIREHILKMLNKNDLIYSPNSYYNARKRLFKYIEEAYTKSNKKPPLEELGAFMKLDLFSICQLLLSNRRTIPLDQPFSDMGEQTPLDTLVDPCPHPYENIYQQNVEVVMKNILETLTEREETVLLQ